MIRARIYSERPDWWLLVRDEKTVLHHRRYWTWDGAMAGLRLLRVAVSHAANCDGKCAP